MGFFGNIFHPPHAESIIFIHVSAGSVAGAYAQYKKNKTPALLYARRVAIDIRDGEPQERALQHALEILGSFLIREGAPVLARYSGSGSADTIFVSVDAPWQETKVHTEHFERETPFTFTKKMVTAALEKTTIVPQGKLLANESVVGTSLNGYHVREPYGKNVHRASATIFTSFIDATISKIIAETIQHLFHTKNILSIAGTSLRYQAIRTMFPHEHHALMLDTMGPLISIALVRKDFLTAVEEVSDVNKGSNTYIWIKKIMDEFVKLAEQYPLPRTIFLLAQEPEISSLEQALAGAKLGGLWLSDNPPRVVPIPASHIVGAVRQVTTDPPDLPLLLMALYWQHRSKEN